MLVRGWHCYTFTRPLGYLWQWGTHLPCLIIYCSSPTYLPRDSVMWIRFKNSPWLELGLQYVSCDLRGIPCACLASGRGFEPRFTSGRSTPSVAPCQTRQCRFGGALALLRLVKRAERVFALNAKFVFV